MKSFIILTGLEWAYNPLTSSLLLSFAGLDVPPPPIYRQRSKAKVMEYLRIKNWRKYQQCDRNAPWIKLHTEILQNYSILNLSDSDKLSFFMILIFAGRSGNKIPNDEKFLSSIFCMDNSFNMSKLIDIDFLEVWTEELHIQSIEEKQENIEKRRKYDREKKRKIRASDSENKMSDSDNPMSELPETETETETYNKPILSKMNYSEIPKDWLSACMKEKGYPENVVLDIWDGFREYWQNGKGKSTKREKWDATWRTWYRGQNIKGITLQKPKPTLSNVGTL